MAYLDIAFPDLALAIKVDGWAWHRDTERFQNDRRRQNIMVTAGWAVLRFTWAGPLDGASDRKLSGERRG